MWNLILSIPSIVGLINKVINLIEAAIFMIKAKMIENEIKKKSKQFSEALREAASDKSPIKSTQKLEDIFRGKS